MIPIVPLAIHVASETSLCSHPNFAVLAFSQAIHPVVGQSIFCILDGEQVPFRTIFQVSATNPIGSGPGRNPHVAIGGLQCTINERIAQSIGNVVVFPFVTGLVIHRHTAAIRPDQHLAIEFADVKNAV